MCLYGFRGMSLHRIVAASVEGNRRSQRVLEAVGFREEGRFRKAALLASRWADVRVYGLLKGELVQRSTQ
jgi:[ribosomal protein S5]-alanine N-acetyltransferase